MKITKRGIFITLGATVVLGTITAILIARSKKKSKIKLINDILVGNQSDPNLGGQTIIPQSEYDKLPNGNFPLKVGDKNKKVYSLQKALASRYGSKIDLDGKFGQGTYDSLCDNYWNWCGSSVGLYQRTVSQSDYDEIVTKTATTS